MTDTDKTNTRYFTLFSGSRRFLLETSWSQPQSSREERMYLGDHAFGGARERIFELLEITIPFRTTAFGTQEFAPRVEKLPMRPMWLAPGASVHLRVDGCYEVDPKEALMMLGSVREEGVVTVAGKVKSA